MPLTTTDWVVIVGYLLINLLIGIYYRRRASGNTAEFFISGRDVSWWLAGTSMVATTFAADTPLLVTGLVATQGIAGNWLWWNQALGNHVLMHYTLGEPRHTALMICVFVLIPFTGIYTFIGGLWGVLVTDLFQFILKMSMVTVLAWVAVSKLGGINALTLRLQ